MIRNFNSWVSLVFISSALCAQTVGNIGNRQISLPAGETLSQISPNAKISTKDVQLAPNEKLSDKLQQFGVQPNSDAWSVIYTINPGVEKFDDAGKFSAIKIPAIEGFDSEKDQPMALIVDAPVKHAIASNAELLTQRTATAPADKKVLFTPAVDALGQTTQAINSHPASRLFLDQVNEESQLLDRLLRKPALAENDKSTVLEITSDLKAKAQVLQKDVADPSVIVKTIAAADQKEVSLLTICYVPVALDTGSCDHEFERPTSPTDRRLPVANYHIWAKDSAGQRVSESKRVEIRADSLVTLVINH
jgi:hypothetical protein